MKIAVIGTGNMGKALMEAFCQQHTLFACNRGREKLLSVCEKTGATACDSVQNTVFGCDLVLLAVKPNMIPQVMEELKPVLEPHQIVVSVAVGLTIASYAAVLGRDKQIVRAMPNTPAAVKEGLTAFSFADTVTEENREKVLELFSLAGRTAVLPEKLMNSVSALTGSSPAFVYMFIEAMADGGVQAGIPRSQAIEMAAQAVLGAAKMVLETGEHPGALKDAVCSPGGTTIRGVAALEQGAFRGTVMDAICATVDAAKIPQK